MERYVAPMRLLDRYLLRELLTPLAFCLGGFTIFWISFDLAEKLNVLQEHKLHGGEVVLYELLRMPELLGVVLPVALLLAALYALTNHARHHELTAIRAAGVSLWRLATPYLAVGLAASVFLFVVSEIFAPRGANMAERILNRYTGGNAKPASAFEKVFFHTRGGQHWIANFNPQTRELRDVHIDWQREDGSRMVFAAASAVRSNGQWVFSSVAAHTEMPGMLLPVSRITTNLLVMQDFSETPEQITSDLNISRLSSKSHVEQTQIPVGDLFQHLRRHPEMASRDRRWALTQLHSRLAGPWTCLIVILIAIPFGAVSGRRNVFVGVASSIFICFIYFMLLQFGLAMGTGGYLPPWLGAWLPNLFFGSIGAVLTTLSR